MAGTAAKVAVDASGNAYVVTGNTLAKIGRPHNDFGCTLGPG